MPVVPDVGEAAFWPTRASSTNHSSTRSASGCRSAASRITPGEVFGPLLRLGVGLGVDRAGLLPRREVEALEQLEHPALAVADPEPRLDRGARVAGAPVEAAVALKVRVAQGHGLQGGLLPLVGAQGRPGRSRGGSARVRARR